MIKLTKGQVILLHTQLIEKTGGSNGIRDEGLLDSALYAPFQSYAGTDNFPSIQQKAARLGFGLVKNHAFIDGNKRIGAHAMLVFLALNGIELEYTQEDLANTILKIAASELSLEGLLRWIIEHQL
ncbi:MAG: type II toxin-antitoxin system death-on-curing family toxin [Blautia sp.]|jgi:death-on-curing protein